MQRRRPVDVGQTDRTPALQQHPHDGDMPRRGGAVKRDLSAPIPYPRRARRSGQQHLDHVRVALARRKVQRRTSRVTRSCSVGVAREQGGDEFIRVWVRREGRGHHEGGPACAVGSVDVDGPAGVGFEEEVGEGRVARGNGVVQREAAVVVAVGEEFRVGLGWGEVVSRGGRRVCATATR